MSLGMFYAVPKAGGALAFHSPYDAMRALDRLGVEGDIYTGTTEKREHLGHRKANGEWTYAS